MRARMRNGMMALVGCALLAVGCGGSGDCKKDEDCRKGAKDKHKVCYEGRCVSLKGESGRAKPPRNKRRKLDPNVDFRVPVDLKKSPSKGPADALVTVVEVSEFQCPYCGRAAKTMDKLAKAFPKKVRLVFMHNPLGFHKQAQLAAEASQAVFALKGADAFWKFHDKLFANRKKLGRESLDKFAQELGVDMKKFKEALDKRTYKKLVKDQQRMVTKLGARGAPAFFVNGRFLSGARPLPEFKGAVNKALARAKKIMAKGVAAKDVYTHIMKKAKTKAVYAK